MKRAMKRTNRGITMVEAMVALVVISVGMLGIAGLYLSSLQAGRSANLRIQAVNLASEMADRIRANRTAKGAYALTAGTLPTAVDCATATCTPAQLAQSDQNLWVTSLRRALPGSTAGGGSIAFTDVPDPLPDRPQPDRYTITVTWREAGSNNDATYILVIEV
jgi:type IV pilus assembly protein PilV